jgi:hypothetical protein
MTANRSKFASGDIMGGTIDEKIVAFDSYISYCGRYEIQQDKVIHHIEASLFPDWTGGLQERFFEFENDKLSLSTPPSMMGGIQQTAHLIWERVV